MFCPKCGTDNLDSARFCRKCGSDISLVPQALTGGLVQNQTSIPEGEREEKPNLERGIKKFLMGLIFLIIAIAPVFSRHGFWWWMLFPAAPLLAAGIAELVRFKHRQTMMMHGRSASLPSGAVPQAMPPAPAASEFPSYRSGELYPEAPSVTEGTTRHLGTEAPTRHIAAPFEEQEKKG